jgi:hypothetical protein
MQLVAYGTQDIVLTSNPEITFFKVVYRRHTNFAIESISQTFNGTVGFGKKVSATISRNGDLITDCWLEITLTKSSATFYPAEALLREIKLEIGGQQIDKHYDDWLRVHDSLFRSNDEKDAYRRLADFVDAEPAGSVKRFYVPLVFFFNTQPGLALPLIALQYHEVKIEFDLASSVTGIDSSVTPAVTLWVDYIFLDVDERRRFAQSAHEYLIEQLQFTGAESVAPSTSATTSVRTRLNFNHPCKYLAWVVKGSNHGQYTTFPTADVGNTATRAEALAPVYDAKLTLNGHDRFDTRRGSYFNQVQPMQTMKVNAPAGVYLYSFALKPHEHQPSGTCNFSRIDNATLLLTLKKGGNTTPTITSALPVQFTVNEDSTASTITNLTNLRVYAKNYNILRIMSGMGGLAYAN